MITKAKFQHICNRVAFSGKLQQTFLEDLLVLVQDGIPPNKALVMLGKVYSGISKKVVLEVLDKSAQGLSLANSMSGWFNINVIELVRAGEEGGALVETLSAAKNTMTNRNSSLTILLGSVAYPLLVIIMACLVIVYLDHSVLIDFEQIKPVDQWPSAGQELIMIARGLQQFWWLIIALIIAAIAAMRYGFQNYVGEFRQTLDDFPLLNIYRKINAARLMQVFGLLTANGITFKRVLQVMQYHASPYISYHLVIMQRQLSQGKSNIADMLNTGLIDKSDILRLTVISEVKGFEQALIRLGEHSEQQTTKMMKLLAKIFSSILLVVGAWLIIVLIKGLYLTGMSLGS